MEGLWEERSLREIESYGAMALWEDGRMSLDSLGPMQGVAPLQDPQTNLPLDCSLTCLPPPPPGSSTGITGLSVVERAVLAQRTSQVGPTPLYCSIRPIEGMGSVRHFKVGWIRHGLQCLSFDGAMMSIFPRCWSPAPETPSRTICRSMQQHGHYSFLLPLGNPGILTSSSLCINKGIAGPYHHHDHQGRH